MGRFRANDELSDIDMDEEAYNIDVIGREVFFSGSVTDESMHELVTKVKGLEQKLLNRKKSTITLYIRSWGGDFFAGMSCMDHLKRLKVKIITVADGFCASAATFILMGSDNRKIMPHAHLMIHQISSGTNGKYEEIRETVRNCDKLMNTMKTVYQENTELPQDKMKKLLKRDIYFTADECEEFGIAKKM